MVGRPALILGDEARSFADLDVRSDRLAAALGELGAGPGRPVAAALPNGFEVFEASDAAAKLGAPFVPVNWHLKTEELAFIVEDSAAAVLVAAPGTRAKRCPTLVTGEPYEEALARVAEEGVEPRDRGGGPLPMLYTSGTTARPRGIVNEALSGEVMRFAMESQAALWWWTDADVHLLCGPCYHAGPYGWTQTALFVGATTVIMPSWDAREWLRLVARHRVTRAFMVPAHFIRLLEVPEAERSGHDLSSLRLIVHGAAPCPSEVKRTMIEWLSSLGCEIHELYGASEGGATRIGPDEWLRHPGSVGTPWPGVEIRILDGDGNILGPGQNGLIYIRSPMGRFSYRNDPQNTAKAWRGEAFTVGDIGCLDSDGFLYITDRASDMVLWGGVNISPREVEDTLHAHPGVVDCAVFGVPHERDGEWLKAVVEVRPGTTEEELANHVRSRLADYKVPRSWQLVDELPRDENGKVLKRYLRDAHWTGRRTKV